ncbi:hypothetical protein ZIOFF_060762 [Zingiber officinale]|uniref:Uncharacterized protein n=1 Tax=Zingiber officinale TaxID=94328 RepID=A0A8J5FPI3_ZINOF|nr:hypothetical protein ZIOFF_060762 [Zingiber officinale]
MDHHQGFAGGGNCPTKIDKFQFLLYASLPRVEARLYLEQYGGGSDIWIGKTLYRMPLVNNDMYLELAKLDFNHCQAHHQLEWLYLQKLGWVRTLVFSKAISAYFGRDSCTDTMRQALILNFLNADDCYSNEHGTNRLSKTGMITPRSIDKVIEDMSIQVNVPALAMEEVAPLAVSDAAMLALEEIFHGKGNIKEEAELTKEERKRRRANQKRRFRRLKVGGASCFDEGSLSSTEVGSCYLRLVQRRLHPRRRSYSASLAPTISG